MLEQQAKIYIFCFWLFISGVPRECLELIQASIQVFLGKNRLHFPTFAAREESGGGLFLQISEKSVSLGDARPDRQFRFRIE